MAPCLPPSKGLLITKQGSVGRRHDVASLELDSTTSRAFITDTTTRSGVDSRVDCAVPLAPTAYWPGVSGARAVLLTIEDTLEVGSALCLRDTQEAVGPALNNKLLDARGHWVAHVDYAAVDF